MVLLFHLTVSFRTWSCVAQIRGSPDEKWGYGMLDLQIVWRRKYLKDAYSTARLAIASYWYQTCLLHGAMRLFLEEKLIATARSLFPERNGVQRKTQAGI